MKKKYTILALLAIAAMVMTGCSWEEVKEKFVGVSTGAAVDEAATGSAVVEIEDYTAGDCVTLGEYKGVEVDCTVSEEEIQEQIDSLVAANPTKVKKGKAKKGMKVNIDYTGKKDGKEFDGGTAQSQEITLGESGFIDGFDDGVIGMKVGQTKDLNLTFPSDYGEKSLAGQDVVFTVKLNHIVKDGVFNDAMVKKTSDYKTTEEWKKAKKKELADEKKSSAGSTVLSKIFDSSTVKKLPETMRKAELQQADYYYRQQISSAAPSLTFAQALSQMGYTMDLYESQLSSTAESNAKMQLIMEAIAEKEGFLPTDEEVKNYINEQMTTAGYANEAEFRSGYEQIYGKAISFEDYMKRSYLYEKMLEFLANNASLKE